MSTPLVPVIPQATATIDAPNVANYVTALLALTPVEGFNKTAADVVAHHVTINRGNGSAQVQVQFK